MAPGSPKRLNMVADKTRDALNHLVDLWGRRRALLEQREALCRHDGTGHQCLPCSVFRQLH